MVDISTVTGVYYKLSSDADDQFVLDSDGTLTGLTAGVDYDVVCVGQSSETTFTADTTPVISGLVDQTPAYGDAATVIDLSGFSTGTNLVYSVSSSNGDIDWATISGSNLTITHPASGGAVDDDLVVTVSNAAGSNNDAFNVTYASVIPEVPSAITDLAATSGDTEVTLTWTAPAENNSAITDYTIFYRLSSGGSYIEFDNGVSASTGATVTGLTNDTEYEFVVYVINGEGASLVSNTATETPATISALILSNGWTIESPSDVQGDSLSVTRYGDDPENDGLLLSVSDTLSVTSQKREIYNPDNPSLGTDWPTVVYTDEEYTISDEIYSTDVVAGVTNNSAKIAPKPQAMWDCYEEIHTIDGTIRIRVFVDHRHGRDGEPVRAVKFKIDNGSTVVTKDASIVTRVSSRTGLPKPCYEWEGAIAAELGDGSSLTTCDVWPVIYPFVGSAFDVSTDAESYPTKTGISPIKVYLDERANPIVYAAVDGVGAAPATSTSEATALTTPYATYDAAAAAAYSANGNDISGIKVIILSGVTAQYTDWAYNKTCSAHPMVIEGENATTSILSEIGSTDTDSLGDKMVFKDLTFALTNASASATLGSRANNDTNQATNILIADNVLFDENGLGDNERFMTHIGRVQLFDSEFNFDIGTLMDRTGTALFVRASGSVWQYGRNVHHYLACVNSHKISWFNGGSTNPTPIAPVCAYTYAEIEDADKNFAEIEFQTGDRGMCIVYSCGACINGFDDQSGDGQGLELGTEFENRMFNVNIVGFTLPSGGSFVGFDNAYEDSLTPSIDNNGYEKEVFVVGSILTRGHMENDQDGKSGYDGKGPRDGALAAGYGVGWGYNLHQWAATTTDMPRNAGSKRGEIDALGSVYLDSLTPPTGLFTVNASGSGTDDHVGGDYTILDDTNVPKLPSRYVRFPVDLYGNAIPLDGSALAGAASSAVTLEAPSFDTSSSWSLSGNPTAGEVISAVSGTVTGEPTPVITLDTLNVNDADGTSYASGLDVTFPTTLPDASIIDTAALIATNSEGTDTDNLPDLTLFNNKYNSPDRSTVQGLTAEASPFGWDRCMVMYGDSRMATASGGLLSDNIVTSVGHKAWVHYTQGGYNYGSGGQPIEHMITDQIPNMLIDYPTDVPEIAVVMMGTNGAGGGQPNTAAGLINRMTQAIADMEAAGHTLIYLFNEMPSHGNVYDSSPTEFYNYHIWLQDTAPSLATTSTIVSIDSWTACGDPRYLTDIANYALHPDTVNDGVHAGCIGYERIAALIAEDMNTRFTTSIADFSTSATNQLDGSLSNVSVNDGVYDGITDTFSGTSGGELPNGWNYAFIDPDAGLFCRVFGTGHDTSVELRNTTGSRIAWQLRPFFNTLNATDGVVTIMYEIADKPDAYIASDTEDRDLSLRVTTTGTSVAVDSGSGKTAISGDLNGAQNQRLGGYRYLSFRVGAASSDRMFYYTNIPANSSLIIHGLAVRER